jgi:hypothetical protein
MTKRPRKTRQAETRDVSAGSNTLRNRALIAAALLAALGATVWKPWAHQGAVGARAVATAPLPPIRPQLAALSDTPSPAATTATSSTYVTAAAASMASAPLPSSAPAAVRMPATLQADFDAWLIDAYRACYTPPQSTPDGDPYLPRVRIALKADGTLAGAPKLVNPPWDPAWKAHAEAAIKAVKSCDPLHVPDKYAPYYAQWKTKTVFFDPTRS